MKFYLKLFIIYILRLCLFFFYIFPVKRNRIFFSSYEGLSYTCNPKYIFQSLYRSEGDKIEYVWCLNNSLQLPERYSKNVKVVTFLSLKYFYYLLTSKVIVSNLGVEPYFPKRKGQIFINTWHGGGAYKKVSSDLSIFSKAQSFYVKTLREIRKKNTDIFISSSRAFTEVAAKDFHIHESAFVNTGMPRNDILVNQSESEINRFRNEISKTYNIPKEALWVLYAPTFRGTYRTQKHIDNQIINPAVKKAFSDRFHKDVVILNRAHISKDKASLEIPSLCIDVTAYPDMQELLLASDILITDYSSSVWDFGLTKKPGFLFVPDLEEYNESIGFYTPIEKWGFPYTKTLDELCKLIREYNEEEALKKIEAHILLLDSYEHGTACEQMKEIINSKIERN